MGKYRVSERIGRGGMAEVFLARQEGMAGFEKLVALKRIYPHLIHDENFIEMFLEEARIAASLQHPKIVQILDIERDDDGFFIVMEYLAGESLRSVQQLLFDREERIPPAIVCRIASDVATGLHVAHSAFDAEGQPRPVVHRDVTPSNLLVTFSGEVKVLDFGVAKALKRQITTDKGVLKGKTTYLSPEQIQGVGTDPRADIFQLGIVIHEMLTGRALFDGESVGEIVKKILESEIPPPSSVAGNGNKELDKIVLRALQRDPDQRFQTADQLAQELDRVAGTLGAPVTERTLARWMSDTFPARAAQKSRLRREALDQRAADYEPGEQDPASPRALLDAEEEQTLTPSRSAVTALERPIAKAKGMRRPRLVRSTAIVVGAAALATLLFAIFRSGGSTGSASLPAMAPDAALVASAPTAVTADAAPPPSADARIASFSLSIAAVPHDAVIELDGAAVGTGEYSAILEARVYELRLSAPGHVAQRITVSPDHPAPAVVRLQPIEQSPAGNQGGNKPEKTKESPESGGTRPFGSDNLDPWENP